MISPVEQLEDARRAHAAHDWVTAFEILKEQDSQGELFPEDLAALADAAWWVGDLDTCIAARERLYERKAEAGDIAGAAMEAMSVSLRLGDKGEDALASGWRARAYRLASQEPRSLAGGYLLSLEADSAFHAGELESCITKSAEVIEIGTLHNDQTLVAWGTHLQGLGLSGS